MVQIILRFLAKLLAEGHGQVSSASPSDSEREAFRTDAKAENDYFVLGGWETWETLDPKKARDVVDSAAGCQQGDPLGPLLFAAALQPLANELRTGPLELAPFFLDDGVLAGSTASVAAALALVQTKAAEFGLQLNLSKCELVAVGSTPPASLSQHFPRPLLVDADGGDRVLRNFELLGAALGDDAFVAGVAAARVEKASALLDALAELQDSQVGVHLLRFAQVEGHSFCFSSCCV
jgi:hypothetical protein